MALSRSSSIGWTCQSPPPHFSIFDPLSYKLLIFPRHSTSKDPFDISSFFTYIAFDVTGEVTFSRPFGFLETGKDIGNAIATNIGLQIFLCVFGYFQYASYLFNNPLMTWLGWLPVGHLALTASAALQDRQKNPDAKFDMAAHWFRGVEKAKKDGYEGFNNKHVLSASVANLGAGSGESSVAQ